MKHCPHCQQEIFEDDEQSLDNGYWYHDWCIAAVNILDRQQREQERSDDPRTGLAAEVNRKLG